jgi:hypothetical protein
VNQFKIHVHVRQGLLAHVNPVFEEALEKYRKYTDEIILAEYSHSLLGLMEQLSGRVDVLTMIVNKSRVYIQPEGKIIFDTLFRLNADI